MSGADLGGSARKPPASPCEEEPFMRVLPIAGIAVTIAFTALGCSSTHAAPAAVSPAIPAAAKTVIPIQPVPGTNKNKYAAGPFTITLVHGIIKGPDGHTASEVLVQNTSNDFTGIAQPEVEYFQGNTVLGTNIGTSDPLTPGQQETVWVYPVLDKDVSGQWVDAQLITLWYGTALAEQGSRLQLAH